LANCRPELGLTFGWFHKGQAIGYFSQFALAILTLAACCNRLSAPLFWPSSPRTGLPHYSICRKEHNTRCPLRQKECRWTLRFFGSQ
jgi:hypothetical protein